MKSSSRYPASPLEMFRSFARNFALIKRMAVRDVVGRYNESVLGIAWSFFNPLIMLAIYTFVFSVVFKSTWNKGGGQAEFALFLFVGMIVHGLLAECVNTSPSLVLSNASYVKKVVFPLEILPYVSLLSATFHALVSIVILLLATLILTGGVPWTAVFFPLIYLPLALFTLGLSWFIAALGVYLRDVAQITMLFTTALMFLSGVFYPLSALPEAFRFLGELNPLAYLIDESRQVLLEGQILDFRAWAFMTSGGAVAAWLGFAWFQKTRGGFADVV